ncbi:MAG: hypothetical protein ACI9BW_000955 [Gammaproteobacteria bacterium]|jgi:hypothetical protein
MSFNPPSMTINLDSDLRRRITELDLEGLKHDFVAQDEFVAIPDFLPTSILNEVLAASERSTERIHRNYIPRHKKGGSVSRYDIDRTAPVIAELYQTATLIHFLSQICGCDLNLCPPNDPHTYALYYYTEPGDHIGYHYDTSYYQGARYTVLLGLLSSPSCQLEYQLHTKNTACAITQASIELTPGQLVLFNGDKLYHRITPLAENERRVALTFEYLTNTRMHPFLRFVSNMKDSIAYFGFRQVFSGQKKPAPTR